MLEVEDDGFVTINLDSSRCDICQLDTGEDLVPCSMCRQEISTATLKSGFNALPTHANITAHRGCLWKEHQVHVTSLYHSPWSPANPYINCNPSRSNSMFDLMTGNSTRRLGSSPGSPRHHSVSQPATPPVVRSPNTERRFTMPYCKPLPESAFTPVVPKCREEMNKDAFNSKLKRLLRKAKNKQLFENKKNDYGLSVRSSPVTRCSSPVLINKGGHGFPSKSEKNLTTIDVDPNYLALRQGYVRYLFGNMCPKDDVTNMKQRKPLYLKGPTLKSRSTIGGVVKHECDNRSAREHFNNNNGSDNEGNDNKTTESEEVRQKKVQESGSDTETSRRDKSYLLLLSSNQLKDMVENISSTIKEISDELVDLLEERDELRHGANVRHLTIEKLVRKEKASRVTYKT